MITTSLESALRERLTGRVVVMGIGNASRGDDAAGSEVAHRLRSLLSATAIRNLTLVDAEEVPESYLGPVREAWPDTVVLVDAVDLHAAGGSVALLESDELAAATPLTHRTPLRLLANYLEQQAGARVYLLGIQPCSVEWGTGMCPAVAAAASDTATLLLSALRANGGERAPAAGPEAMSC